MPRPLRLSVVVLVVALASAACGGEAPAPRPTTDAPAPSSSAPSVTPSPSPTSSASASPSASLEPQADVELPRRAPSVSDQTADASDVDLDRMAPRGTTLGDTWRSDGSGFDAVAFAWSRPDGASGFEVWSHEPDGWRAVYAFTDEPPTDVLGVTFDTGDVTGDATADALTFESTGGSGACGTWRVVAIAAGAEGIWSRVTCDTDVRLVGGDLAVREAVYQPDDPHCCPSAYRTTTSRWTGTRWKVVSRSTTPA